MTNSIPCKETTAEGELARKAGDLGSRAGSGTRCGLRHILIATKPHEGVHLRNQVTATQLIQCWDTQGEQEVVELTASGPGCLSVNPGSWARKLVSTLQVC